MKPGLHTPWSDEITLVRFDPERDPEGYNSPIQSSRTIIGTFEDGVSQSEFYRSAKAGMQASASVEVWDADYEGETFAEFRGRRYRVIRSFQSGFDYRTLILQEVIR